jgi:myo-inositol-1(or 4)-monophosphatase
MKSELDELLNLAREVARSAAEVLLEGRPDPARRSKVGTDTKTSPTDIVTEKDLASEQLIKETLQKLRPNDGLIGEEGSNIQSTSGYTWIVDPLDGTINYLYGSPQWAVSIAVADEDGPVIGVVYAPLAGYEYFGVRGQGAFRVDQLGEVALPIITDEVDLAHALFATGFGYKSSRRTNQARVIAQVLPQIRDIRRKGSAAIDICMAATGMVDGYFERGANPWDYAAASVVARECGLVVSGLFGKAEGPDMVVAAPAKLHAQITSLLEELQADSGD